MSIHVPCLYLAYHGVSLSMHPIYFGLVLYLTEVVSPPETSDLTHRILWCELDRLGRCGGYIQCDWNRSSGYRWARELQNVIDVAIFETNMLCEGEETDKYVAHVEEWRLSIEGSWQRSSLPGSRSHIIESTCTSWNFRCIWSCRLDYHSPVISGYKVEK